MCCGKRKDNDRVITTVTTTGCKLRNTLFDMPYENKFISPHIRDGYGLFVVHAHECVLSINEDGAGFGYAKIYRALLQATGKELKHFQFFLSLFIIIKCVLSQTHLILLNDALFSRQRFLWQKQWQVYQIYCGTVVHFP